MYVTSASVFTSVVDCWKHTTQILEKFDCNLKLQSGLKIQDNQKDETGGYFQCWCNSYVRC